MPLEAGTKQMRVQTEKTVVTLVFGECNRARLLVVICSDERTRPVNLITDPDSFVSSLTRDSMIIAPLFVDSSPLK
jgi:hypothetical protein